MASGIAVSLPLNRDPVNGYEMLQTYREVAAQNLKMLVLTSPGERIMDPHFGVGIRKFLFEPSNSLTYESLRAVITNQVRKYLPYIEIVDIDIEDPEEGQSLAGLKISVSIQYFIRALEINDNININIDSI